MAYPSYGRPTAAQKEAFGRWLRREIELRHWSVNEFARQMGGSTSSSTVSKWLLGGRMPLFQTAKRLAEVLGIDVDTIYAQAGMRPDDTELTDLQRDLIALIKRLPDDLLATEHAKFVGLLDVDVQANVRRQSASATRRRAG